MHDPFDVNNYRSRATNARKTPLYVGQEADRFRRGLAGFLGYIAFWAVVAGFAWMLLHGSRP